MNKSYRLIYNDLTNTWVAVAEIVKARGKRASGAVLLAAMGIIAVSPAPTFAAPPNPPAATALPTGGNVVAGTANIAQSGATLNITQSTNRAAIDWATFNVGSSATVNFIQPSSSAATLNRVLDPNPSQIFGRINANGQVFLTNSSGIYFGRSASVNVGALTATTHGIRTDDFMAGKLNFTRDGATGKVENDGNLTAELNGYIALLAPEVRNNGVVIAQGGTVALAAGEAFELQFDGARLANIRVEPATIAALVENGNAVHAPGGLIILSAKAANELQAGVINNSGSLAATGLSNVNGVIRLEATQAIVQTGTLTAPTITASTKNLIDGGTWDASATTNKISNGGSITVAASGSVEQVSAASMKVGAGETAGNAGAIRLTAGEGVYLSGQFDASSTTNKGGEIALTAPDVTLAGAQLHADGASGGGRIRIGGGWQGSDADLANANTTQVNGSTTLTANATQQGTGGTVVLWSEQETTFAGRIEAKGGAQGGDGGQVEISSHDKLGFNGTVETPAAAGMGGSNGRLLLDPKNITIVAGGSSSTTNTVELTYASRAASDGAPTFTELSNGNIIALSVGDDRVATDAGATRLFKPDGTLLATVAGSVTLEGAGMIVQTLTGNGNFVVRTPRWGGGGTTAANAFGAVTWVNGATGALVGGAIGGTISSSNSLVGSTLGDRVGTDAVQLISNGNYLVRSPNWNAGNTTTTAGMGAVTWGSGTAGMAGVVSSSNSLVGTTIGDRVGSVAATLIPNGNYLVSSPNWGAGSGSTTTGKGAVTWGSGTAGVKGVVTSSNSLVGSTAGDFVGYNNSFPGIQWLGITGVSTSNNYVINSMTWDNGGTSTNAKGAATWINGTTGLLADGSAGGIISSTNSLVGATVGAQVGRKTTPLTNGNYVVEGLGSTTGTGIFTWGNGANGTVGTVSLSNSLMGSTAADYSANNPPSVLALTNGNYVVRMIGWNDVANSIVDASSITWGDGSTNGTRLVGNVSVANSLIGSSVGDALGTSLAVGILTLANGNYVVSSPSWGLTGGVVGTGKGAVTWVNGSNGQLVTGSVGGVVSNLNSWVGSTAGDQVGRINAIALTGNNNFVFASPDWDNAGVVNAGAVTWGNGSTGGAGVLTVSNSLVSSTASDFVGITDAGFYYSGLKALANGNYVVASPLWKNAGVVNAGAVTWGNGASGTTGAVALGNSLVGSNTNDRIGSSGGQLAISTFTNGNYAVGSPTWGGGKGAVTWVDGSTGGTRPTGAITATNSLVGSGNFDSIGQYTFNQYGDNYFIDSRHWGGTALNSPTTAKGAYTWGSIATGHATGVLSATTSVVGSTAGDFSTPGFEYLRNNGVITGAVVMTLPSWDLDGTHTNVGASIYLRANATTTGVVSSANALIGATTDDGLSMAVTQLTNGSALNGNYIVSQKNWDNGAAIDAGAVAWGSATAGVSGTISTSNSLYGTTSYDRVGNGVLALKNGSYLVSSPYWSSTANDTTSGKGALTVSTSSSAGMTGAVSATNSVLGSTNGDRLGSTTATALTVGSYTDSAIVQSPFWSGGLGRFDIVRPGIQMSTLTNPQTYGINASSDSYFSVAQLTSLLNAGTNVSLQANNDITVNAALTVDNTGGNGGALTLEAGRSMLVNANITTDNGNLTLRTNTRSRDAASGDYSANRDAGTAVFTMASGTTLNAGSGNVLIEAINQSDSNSSGSMTLGSISANTIKVSNNYNMYSSRMVIRSGSVLTSTAASGNGIVLETTYGFTNQAGSGALVVNNTGGNTGRWLVYSQGPQSYVTAKDGLTSNFRRYNLNSWTTPNPALSSGNGFIYNSGQGSLFVDATLASGTATHVYGNTPTASFNYSFRYQDNEDTAPTVTGTPSFLTAAPSSTTNFGNYYIRYGTSGLSTAGNDTFALGTSVAYSVTARALQLTGSKVYDNTRDVLASALTVGNRVGSDVITLTGTISNATTNDHVGTNLSLASLTGLGLSNSNYTLTGGSGTVSVTQKPITVSSLTATGRAYDGTTAATISAGALAGVIGGDTVSFSPTGLTGAFANKNVGAGKTVTATGTGTLASADAGDYVLSGTLPTTTATITAKQLTLAGSSSITKTYDGTTAMASGVAGYGTLGGLISGDAVTVSGAPVFGQANAGTGLSIARGTVGIAGADAGNYTIGGAFWTNGTGNTIAKAPLTLTMNNASKVLTDTDPGFSARYTGFVNGETSAVLSAPTFSRAAGESAATYAINSTTPTATNYTVTPVSGTFTIQPADTLLIQVANASDKVYGAALPSFTTTSAKYYSASGTALRTLTLTPTGGGNYSYTDNVGGGATTGTFSLSTTATTASDVGNYPVTVSNFTQTGSNFSSRQTQTGYMAVTPLAANLSITAPSRVYDGTTAIAGSLVTSSTAIGNKLGSDDVAISGAGAFVDKNVGSGNRSWDYTGLTLTGLKAGNYSLASNTRSGTTGTITAKSLTWLVDNASSIYGTTATLGSARLNGMVSGDDLAGTVTAYQTGTSTVETPAARTAVGSYDQKVSALSGTDAGNYSVAGTGNTTGTLTIARKAITLTPNAVTKTYDGATTYSVQAGDLTAIEGASGIVAGDDLSGITLAYADKNAGTADKVVSASSATISDGGVGNAAGNYTISYANAATSTITRKSIAVSTAPTAANKTYDGRTDATLSGGALNAGDIVSGDSLSFLGSGTFADANVANGKTVTLAYTLGGSSLVNYTLASASGTTTADITTAALTMTANNNGRVVFDTDPTLTARYSGFVNGETSSVLSSISVTRAAGTSAGNYAITPSATSTNYTITPTNGTFTITPADKLLIQVADAPSKDYGDALPGFTAISAKYYNTTNAVLRTLTLTPSGGNSYTYDDANGTTGGFDLITSATAASNVGAYAVTVSSFTNSASPNFNEQLASNGNLSITQLGATLSAGAVSKVYDGTRSATGATIGVSNKIGSDAVTVSGTGNFGDKNVGSGKSYSFDGLTLGGAAAGNYYLSAGSLSGTDGFITQATLNVNYTGVNKVYDGTNTASVTSALQNLLGNDSVAVNTTAVYSAGKNVGTGEAIAVSGINLSGTDAGNYTTATTGSATGDITARALNVSYSGVNRVYDGGITATVTTADDRISGDTLSITRTAAFGDKHVGGGKAVTLSGVSLSSGDDGANYTVASTGITSADITPRTLNVSFGSGANKTYDGTTVASVAGATDDRVTNDVLTLNASAAFASKDAATGIAVNVSGVNLTGTDAGNYTPVLVAGSLTADILKKALTMTGSTVAGKTYDGLVAATATAGTLSGLVGSEVVGASISSAAFDSAHAGTRNAAITFALTDGSDGGLASNYSLANAAASAVIAAKQLTTSATITGADKTYDGLLAATGSTVAGSTSGTVAGDTVALDVSGLTLAFDNAHAGTSRSISASGNAARGTATSTNAGDGVSAAVAGVAADYALAAQPTVTSVTKAITAKQLTTSATITGADKTYDGTTAATGSTISGSTSGAINGDSVALDTSAVSLSFDSAEVGSNRIISASGNASLGVVTGGGRGAKNGLSQGNEVAGQSGDYTLTSQPLVASVTNAITASSTTGTGTGTGPYVPPPLPVVTPPTLPTPPTAPPPLTPPPTTPTPTPTPSDPGAPSTTTTTSTPPPSSGTGTGAGTGAGTGSGTGSSAPAPNDPGTPPPTPTPPPSDPNAPSTTTTTSTPPPSSGTGTGTGTGAGTGNGSTPSQRGAPDVGGARAGGSSGTSDGGVNTATTSAISVSLVKEPSVQQTGIITVSVPKEMATAGSGFSFPLPAQVTDQASANATIVVTTAAGQPLPGWVRFDAQTKSFVASAVPDGAFPMQVVVVIGGIRTTIVISERNE